MNATLHAQLLARAGGVCECGCKRPLTAGEVDHFFGRAKAEETLETCWVLRPECHYEKTRNWPSARTWLLKFIAHCGRHGFIGTAERTQRKLEWNTAMGPRGAA